MDSEKEQAAGFERSKEEEIVPPPLKKCSRSTCTGRRQLRFKCFYLGRFPRARKALEPLEQSKLDKERTRWHTGWRGYFNHVFAAGA